MKTRFGIIKRAYMWIVIAITLVAGAWLLFGMNINLSSEFTGGVKLTIDQKVESNTLVATLEEKLFSLQYTDTRVAVVVDGENSTLTVKTSIKEDAKVKELSDQIQSFLIENGYIQNADNIIDQAITGPSVGAFMQHTAIKALILGIIFMAIYMMISFSSIRNYIKPEVLALVTVVTMIFDISIPVGAYGFWMMINPTIQIDTVFIIAILTTMGYSINDTIIIFDRVRENMQKEGTKSPERLVYGKIFEDSLRQTMRRSMGTSISTLIVIVVMYILGTGVIKTFAFTIGVGVLAGTASSIFLAAPLAYLLLGKFNKEKKSLE